MSDIDEKFPHLPLAYRRRMAEREQQVENHDDESSQDNDFSEPENDLDSSDKSQDDELAKLRNDLDSERGRRQKLEEENARLRVLADNGSFAAQRLLEIQAERQAMPNQDKQPEHKADDDFDFDELTDELGDLPSRALKRANEQAKLAHDEVLQMKAKLEQEKMQQHRERFSREVAAKIPDIQVLLGNEQFQTFLSNKKSFDGSNALMFVGNVAQNIDINGIDKVRELIEEYKSQQSTPKQRKPSHPPTRSNSGGHAEQEPALKTMTDKDRAYLARLRFQPNSKEKIRQFRAQFKPE